MICKTETSAQMQIITRTDCAAEAPDTYPADGDGVLGVNDPNDPKLTFVAKVQ